MTAPKRRLLGIFVVIFLICTLLSCVPTFTPPDSEGGVESLPSQKPENPDLAPPTEEPELPNEDNPELPPPNAGEEEGDDILSETEKIQAFANINVRAIPSENGTILGTVEKYKILRFYKKTNGWHKVDYEGKIGYVSENYSRIIRTNGREERIESIIAFGKTLVGKPYVFGAPRVLTDRLTLNPSFTGKSFDCSSFIQYIYYSTVGVKLQVNTRTQYTQKLGEPISFAQLQRGDVVFTTNADREHLTGVERIGHVLMYLGDDMILHTYTTGVGVILEPFSPLRQRRFVAAKRYI